MEKGEIFTVFQFEMNSEKISRITPEQRQEAYESIYQDYMYNREKLGAPASSINDYFSWISRKLDIHIVYFEKDKSVKNISFFSKTEQPGKIILHDLTQQEIPYEYIIADVSTFLAGVIGIGYLQIEPEKIINAGLFSDGHLVSEVGGFLFKNEFQSNFRPLLTNPFESMKFNQLRIHKEMYNFIEMIKEIKDDQFKLELEECLEAYENEKFFVCAAGLGSVLEHLLFLAINKHVAEADVKTNENSTASDYIGQLKKEPFFMDRRQSNYLKVVFAMRNSVSHFNKGIFNKDMCDQLLAGIKHSFDTYYMFENRPTLP
ncbi:hypothetical protein [Psychrobacillus antarcticus]|uniref:hypothetical protein n=1 Tax=Psychrobacillus antarcticus TaxID=2879115 RepID=UPI002407B3F6|nr:hypothetical protein [Psychrobacillus antarcticus]